MSDGRDIHPLASVEEGARIGRNVVIGPFCHVSANAELGEGVRLIGHVTILGNTSIGAGTQIWPQAVLGAVPQNKSHKGGETRLIVGANNVIRESVTMHLGTDTARGITQIGDNGYFMAYSHVAHDCVLGDNITFANNATLGGHCEIGDNVTIGGLAAVHQFVNIGRNAFIAGMSAVMNDVIPFGMVAGNRARLRGLNIVGLRRSGMDRASIANLRNAYKMLFDEKRNFKQAIEDVRSSYGDSSAVMEIVDFIASQRKRSLTMPHEHRIGFESLSDAD